MFAPWSVRARDLATVSCPFEWDELATVRPDDLTIATVPARVERDGDPWEHMDGGGAVARTAPRRWWRRDQAAGLLDAPWPPVYPKMEGEPPRVAPELCPKELIRMAGSSSASLPPRAACASSLALPSARHGPKASDFCMRVVQDSDKNGSGWRPESDADVVEDADDLAGAGPFP